MIQSLIRSLAPSDLARPVAGLLPEANDPATWQRLAADPHGQSMLDELMTRAGAMAGEAEPVLPFSSFIRFFRDGDRQEYEAGYFHRRQRLVTFALAVLSGQGEAYRQTLENLLWAICDEYSWCLPAHLDPPACANQPVPVRDPFTTVDLFAAETASALAEISQLLAPVLAPELVWRMRDQVQRRVLDQFIQDGPAYPWESANHNWAAVCGGGVGIAALWLLNDPAALQTVLIRVGGAMDAYLSGFGPDGVCLEGLGYWTYGFGYFTAFAELLHDRLGTVRVGTELGLLGTRTDHLGTELGVWHQPGLRERLQAIAAFPAACQLGDQSLARFSDAPREFHFSTGILCRLADRLGELRLPPSKLAERLADDPCARWARQLRDFVWYRPEYFGVAGVGQRKGQCQWFASAQWLLVSGFLSGKAIGLAAKAGHNDEPHNHNDVGAFMLVAGSDELLEDLGAGRYERDYFRERRYGYFVNGSASHNLPLIDGTGQQAGAGFRATQVQFRQENNWIELTMDIAGAYGMGNLTNLVRTLSVMQAIPDRIQLADTFRFAEAGGHEIRERFVTQLPVRKTASATIIVTGREFELEIHATTPPQAIEIGETSYPPHQGPLQTAQCIDFVFICRDAIADCRFSLEIRPLYGPVPK